MTKPLKNLQVKNKFFGTKTTIYLSLGLHKKHLKPLALKREHPALENMQLLFFSVFVG
jgi:hypothetical protein